MGHGGDIYRNRVNTDLSVNLNPLGTPEEVLRMIRESLGRIGQYPDLKQEEVRREIADLLKVGAECVYAGCGASELIEASVRAVAPKRVLLFEPGFSGYVHAAARGDTELVRHILREDKHFRITEDDLPALTEDTDLLILSDPMNPSGANIDEGILREILDRAEEKRISVILDESFFHLSEKGDKEDKDRSAGLIKRHPGLFIIRSLTKLFSIPGIRAGYMLSSPENIEKVRNELPEWNLPVTSEAAIIAALRVLKDGDFVSQSLELIRKEREYLSAELRKAGLTVFDSDSTFILFKGPEDLYEKMLKEGILIRDLRDIYGSGKGWYRIAVKDHRENESFVNALRGIINGN